MSLAVATIALALAACAPSSPELGVREAGIVDGTRDSGHPEVMLLYNRAGGLCTATLISPRVVLTARHCVTSGSGVVASPSSVSLYVGSSERSLTAEHRARTIFIIPGSSGNIGDGRAEDVALIELTAPASETPRMIALESPRNLLGGEITAVGFGQTPTGSAGTKYIASGAVEGYQGGLIFVDPTVCSGDSGGPAIAADGLIYGVASFIFSPDGRTEPRCGTAPGAYNEIYRHLDWIEGVLEQVGDACIPDESGEICDGLDNDCNEMVDEGCMPLGSACTDGTTCIGGLCADTVEGMLCTQECDPARPALGCPPGFYCGAQGCDGHCVPGSAGAMPIGASCASDTDCASLLCSDPGDGRQRCLPPCRLDEGRCLGGEICLPSGEQCGGCVDDGIVSGLLHGLGEPCGGDVDCRSGMCRDTAGIRECVASCGEGSTCPMGFSCRDAVCVRARGGSIGSACVDNVDCGMGICAASGGRRWCTAECTDASMCPAGFACTPVAPGVSVCAPERALVGEGCASGEDCITGLCATVGSEGTCAQICDPDNACGIGFECRRTSDGSAAVCARPVVTGGGCAVGRGHGGRGTAALIALVLAIGLVMRRRR
ncbi:MAG: trypsin-like serine protease [Myxococcota bacterium]|nr:trypsin-like serine protease [Myxococcota bacterium]